MPAEFLNNIDKYAENKAIVFEGIGFFDVGVKVMLGQWDSLYQHYVHFGQEKKTKEEVIEDLKMRLKPINREKIKSN